MQGCLIQQGFFCRLIYSACESIGMLQMFTAEQDSESRDGSMGEEGRRFFG